MPRRGRVGSQDKDGGHADVTGDRQQPLPQLLVQLGAGRHEHPGLGAAQQLGEALAAECGVDWGGDPDRLRRERGRVQHRGVDTAEGHRVLSTDPERGQCVRDPGDQAGEFGVGPGEAAGVIARVGDPLGGHGVGPGAGGVEE